MLPNESTAGWIGKAAEMCIALAGVEFGLLSVRIKRSRDGTHLPSLRVAVSNEPQESRSRVSYQITAAEATAQWIFSRRTIFGTVTTAAAAGVKEK